MARGDFKQRVTFELDDQASSGVEKIEGRFAKLGSFLASKFTITLGDVANVFKGLAGAVSGVVDAASVQEAAVKSLDQALAKLGPAAANVSKELQAQAAALENTTKFGDEAIIANQALALNLGVAAGDMGKLTQAAVELSAATGKSLESSFVNLARTLNGARGELGELIPELGSMSEASLRAGGALDVVLDRLGGSARAQVKTFAGSLAQLGNAWGSVKEKIGEAITNNDGITRAFEKLREVITSQNFLDAIESIASGIAAVSVAVVDGIASIGEFTGKIKALRERIEELRQKILETLGPLKTLAVFVSGNLFEAFTRLIPGVAAVKDSLKLMGAAADLAGLSTKNLKVDLESSAPPLIDYSNRASAAAASTNELAAAEEVAAEKTKKVAAAAIEGERALLTYEQAQRALRGESDGLAKSLDRSADAAARLNAATGGSLTARDSRNQADVDAALAAGRSTTLGGTRIRTADGSGSRLVR